MKKIKEVLSKLRNKKILIPTVIVLVIVLAVSALILRNNGSILGMSSNPNKETEKVINQIEKLIDLPKNETPILATVSDISKLSKESFYDNAKNGDKVLVFKNSKMAILYRPSENRIIKVGTVTIEEAKPTGPAPSGRQSGVEGASISPTPSFLRVAIYNATKTPGLAKSSGDSLESKYQNIEVVSTANAAGEYTKTLVIDLSGKNKSAAQALAKELKGETGSLPEDETKPEADILIIIASQ